MNGLLGLSKSINTTDEAMSDLNILERMEDSVQKDKDANVNAQKEEQMMYERMYQMSDKMLEKDRNQINKRISMAQDQITEHLRDNGGDVSRFMEQGGMDTLGKISNDIMRSPQAVQYQENKKNLAKILELKEKGMGHLLSPKDLRALEEYENNPNGGPITYSGVMAEVEIPPSANFDYGKEIPLENVLSYNSNMVKIRGNFEMVYPEKEPNMGNIMAFAKEMGYGGTGSNTARLREATAQAQIRAKYKNTRATSSKTQANSFLGNWNSLKATINPTMTLENMNELYPDGLIQGLKKNDPQYNKILHEKSTIVGLKRPLPGKGLDYTDFSNSVEETFTAGTYDQSKSTFLERAFNNDYGLKESYKFMPLSQGKITNRILGSVEDGGLGYEIQDGIVKNFEPTKDMYRMDGVRIDKDNQLEEGEFKGNYKIEGVVTAMRSGDVLLTDVYNGKGEIDKNKTEANDKAMYGQAGGDELKMTTVIALRSENTDDIFYYEIDTGRPDVAQALSNTVGVDDNIQPLVDQENRNANLRRNMKALSDEEEVTMRGAVNTMENEVFQEAIFEDEGKKYWGAQSAGQSNRYPMMKSFYMAFDYLNNSYKRDNEYPQGDKNIYPSQVKQHINREVFTTAAINGGIEDLLKSYEQGNSNENIISTWLEKSNESASNSMEKKQNEELAQKWMQMLSLVNEN